MAREALSVGDKILSENYFQHADHFTRILNEKEIQKKLVSNKNSSDLSPTTNNSEKKNSSEKNMGNFDEVQS